jgi:predicted NBD/HSP70 family sugar kinase
MRVALVDLAGEARIMQAETHPVNQDFSAGFEALCGHIAALSAGQRIEGIGACFPGIIDKNNMVTTANNLPDWTMKPIKPRLEERFGVPVKLLHDAGGAALGEALFGAARHTDRFVYFIWGTGVGAADVKRIDARRYFMFSFENGHHIMDWEGRACNCGQRGCPEVWMGGDMLREYFGADMKTVNDDDPRWDVVVQKAAQTALNTLIFHPVELFVFNGGVIRNRPFLLERMRPRMEAQVQLFAMPCMVLAEKGDQAALFGCAGAFLVDLVP